MSVTVIVLGELVGLYKRRIEQVSLIDPLCGVWNKRGFEIMLRRAERITRRGGQPLSLLFLDLDDFKGVNDGGGHAEGDRVLREFAAGIEGATRPQDTLGRLGGDEFALLLVGVDAEEAERLGRRLREEVRVAEWSFGVAELRPGESLADLVTRADGSMFSEKRDRKGRTTAAEGRIDP
nr:GGDEF domain-containing protein [Leucobacter weissii]